jgi:hypothetical protein
VRSDNSRTAEGALGVLMALHSVWKIRLVLYHARSPVLNPKYALSGNSAYPNILANSIVQKQELVKLENRERFLAPCASPNSVLHSLGYSFIMQ